MADRKRIRWIYKPSAPFYDPRVPELIVLGHSRIAKALFLPEHAHEGSFELAYIERGAVTWETGGVEYPTRTGQFYRSLPGERHRGKLNYIEPCTIWWMEFADPEHAPEFLRLSKEERLELKRRLTDLPRVIDGGKQAGERFRLLRQELMRDDHPLKTALVRLHMLDLLRLLLGPPKERRVPEDIRGELAELAREIERRPERRWTVPDMAARLRVSPSHFHRVFREVHGMSPARFLSEVRIERACRMLEEPRHSIAFIAQELGFATSQYFTSVFKKYRGVTPGEWREASLARRERERRGSP